MHWENLFGSLQTQIQTNHRKHPLNVLVMKVNSPEFNFYRWWLFNLIPFGKKLLAPQIRYCNFRQKYRGEI